MEYNPTNVYISEELIKITKSSQIYCDVVIRGEYLKKIDNVTKINGFLGISESVIESFGILSEITGDFWTSFHNVSSKLINLGSIEKIGGDVNLRYSNISSLGNLKHVGGKLNLRDTPIENLGKLEFIGGDLFLPKRFENNINLDKIEILGKIKYWNDDKNKKVIVDKSELNLTKSNINIPYWSHEYIFSNSVLERCSIDQINFYYYFKDSFINQSFIDIEGNDNYSFVLLYDLKNDYKVDQNIELFEMYMLNLQKYYPKTANYATSTLVEIFEKSNDLNRLWNFVKNNTDINIDTVYQYEQKLERKLLNSDVLIKLIGFDKLSINTKENIQFIKPIIDNCILEYEFKFGMSILEYFQENISNLNSSKSIFASREFKKLYKTKDDYLRVKSIEDKQNKLEGIKSLNHIEQKIILKELEYILKKSEELFKKGESN